MTGVVIAFAVVVAVVLLAALTLVEVRRRRPSSRIDRSRKWRGSSGPG